MKSILPFLLFSYSVIQLFGYSVFAQSLSFPAAKFKMGNDESWKEPSFDDKDWKEIKTSAGWEEQGIAQDGYAWYRIRFHLPSSLLETSYLKKQLNFQLAKIDDADEAYLNGTLIGKTGTFPSDQGGYVSQWDVRRNYQLDLNDAAVLWDQENVLAIKVYDHSGAGGMFGSIPELYVLDLIDGLDIRVELDEKSKTDAYQITVENLSEEKQKGKLQIQIEDTNEKKTYKSLTENIQIKPNGEFSRIIPYPQGKRMKINITYTDSYSGKVKVKETVPPYILTPPSPAQPRINGAKVFGVRPGSPVLYKIAASGEKPVKYEVENLPSGLTVNPDNGIITGILNEPGNYTMTLLVSNNAGKSEREFTLKVGNTLALTPPRGWNSWNCWGPSVTEAKVRSSAQALIDKGLIDYGWTYINIDDCWQADKRTTEGALLGNDRFPDLKGLGDWLHEQGLKYGIYSSPGTKTCAGYAGSYLYEAIDAKMYADWGVDYLKYDWCSYNDVFNEEDDHSTSAYMKPYQVMQKELAAQNRDIVYSLCQYGFKDVWEWGAAVDGNCWRTTGDIVDSWESLKDIGFSQDRLYPFAKPGHWNDPDMLIVGRVGWGDRLHPTRLTVDEQYTHISLWCLLASPLLIGCDISQMDAFTWSLLTNAEVIDINQDSLGKQAKKVLTEGNIQCWIKDLEDGTKAVGLFNLGEEDLAYDLKFAALNLPDVKEIRDVWRQITLPEPNASLKTQIPAHGAILLRIKN
jgi:hypothetical protein